MDKAKLRVEEGPSGRWWWEIRIGPCVVFKYRGRYQWKTRAGAERAGRAWAKRYLKAPLED